ncbi:exo-alpha-sialidase [bacterium]|nr:exo-alpha-sialidase [bacterium]
MIDIVTVAASTPQAPRQGEGDVVELGDGRLLLAYMEFFGDGSDLAQTRIVAAESADGGHTWRQQRVLTETTPGDVNVYSPNLVRAADGGILLLFMRQHTKLPPTITQYVWKSTDEGQTFTPFAEFAVRQDYSLCNAVVKRLASGRLLLPTTATHTVGATPYAHTGCGAVLYSDDDGRTWQEAANHVDLPMRGVMEPHVEETRDGRVVMVMRNQLGSLFLSQSGDGGVSWSKPQTTGLRAPESCPEITRIPATGDLLVIWNNSPYEPDFASHYGKRSPLTAAVSRDEGRSWSEPRDIEDDPRRAFSNPGCRFTRSGQAIVNYWTCEYLPDWRMQDIIDLRVAVLDPAWFYGGHVPG